jgi:ubiquinone/menaquinone biosynthesis C-methylase UbiE
MDNVKLTQNFFNKWQNYHNLVAELDTYTYTAQALHGEARGLVLDIGNGGIFNYDVSQAERIVVVDIAEELVAQQQQAQPDVQFRWGDATRLPVDTDSFDTVLLQMIVHHLAEESFTITRHRTQLALAEAYRALKPGGRLVLLESCLPKPFEIAERLLFPVFRCFLKRLRHPVVFQWNWNALAHMARAAGFADVQLRRVRLGHWVIQLGRKWPTVLTPIRIYKITGHKPIP